MSKPRIIEKNCEDCSHFAICNLKNNLATLKQTTHDLSKLIENKDFNILVECDYYVGNQQGAVFK